MSSTQIVLVIIAAGTLLRLVLAATTGLGWDESYTVGNARLFSLSYVDHAPLHIWLVGSTAKLFGSEAPGLLRLPFVLLFAGTTWLMFVLTRRLFGAPAGVWAVVALTLAPVFTLAHASWVLPDGPALFFLLAAAIVVARILFDDPPPQHTTWLWLAAGALGGLAIMSKYNAAFIFVGTFFYILTVPAARRHLATPGPWLGAALGLVVFAPVIVWNVDNELVGYFFQSRRIESVNVGLAFMAEDVAGQILYLSPWLFVPFAISLFAALRNGRRDPRAWFVALVAIGPIAVFTFFTLWARGYPHWEMPGWLFAIPLFGRDAAALAIRRPRFAYGYMTVSAALFAVVMGTAIWQTYRGGLMPAEAVDPTSDLVDWHELEDALDANGLLGPDAVVAVPHWMPAGKVSFALGPDVPVVCTCKDPQHFRFRYDQTQWAGRDMAVVVPVRNGDWWDVAAGMFDAMEPVGTVDIHRTGSDEVTLTLEIRMGRGLTPPESWYRFAERYYGIQR